MNQEQPIHPARQEEEHLLKDCALRRVKRSGPGGQRRNKVETAVVLEHGPTQVRVESATSRSAEENRQIAIRKLRIELAILCRSQTEFPTALWLGRVRDRKLQLNPRHDDFPALLVEALDAIADADGRISKAAERLGISTSQLIRLLKHEPRAWDAARSMKDDP